MAGRPLATGPWRNLFALLMKSAHFVRAPCKATKTEPQAKGQSCEQVRFRLGTRIA